MLRIDYFLFGYRKFCVERQDIKKCVNIFLSKNISVKFQDNIFLVSERDFSRVNRALKNQVNYTVSEALGVYGILYKNRRRYGLLLAVLFFVALLLLSSSVVWDVRVEGSDNGNEEEILNELREVGLVPGKFWSKLDKSRVEAEMLLNSEYVSWLNINRRGSVAYVSVMDKISHTDTEKKEGYSNIVAERDCVIEEISVKTGYALVKAGETVKKGDVLISGVFPLEMGGGYCYAEGVVIGRFTDKVSVTVREYEEEKVLKSKKIGSVSVNFFGFSVNIYKTYRNLLEECVIIKDKRDLSFFGKAKLPFGIEKEYVLEYENQTVRYTEEKMVKIAASRMQDELNCMLENSNLLRISTAGAFSEGAYTIITDYVSSSDVGLVKEFKVN